MKYAVLILFTCLAMASAWARDGVREYPLTFHLTDPRGYVVYGLSQEATLTSTRPLDEKATVFKCAKPLFTTITLGNENYQFAFDSETGDSDKLDIAYMKGADGNFKDSNPIPEMKRKAGADSSSMHFGPIAITTGAPGNRIPYSFIISLVTDPPGSNLISPGLHCFYRTAGWWTGNANFAGHSISVALLDRDSNGNYGDLFDIRNHSETPKGDRWFADFEGNGYFTFRNEEAADYGDFYRRWGHFFLLQVRQRDGQLWASVDSPPTAKLRANVPDFAVQLATGSGTFIVDSNNGAVEVPVGTYEPIGWWIKQRDRDGVPWTLSGGFEPGFGHPFQKITIREDKPNYLEFPGKFHVIFEKEKTGIAFRSDILDDHGRSLDINRNGEGEPWPQVRIADKKGTPVTRFILAPIPSTHSPLANLDPFIPNRLIAYLEQDTGPFPITPAPPIEFDAQNEPRKIIDWESK